MPDDDTQYQEPTSAKLLGLASILFGHPGGGLEQWKNAIDKQTYAKFEQARRPRELAQFQKQLNLTPDEVNYFAGLPTDQYEAVKPKLAERMLPAEQKPFEPKLFASPSGATSWVTPGQPVPEGFRPYEKPTGQKIPTSTYQGAFMAHLAEHPGDYAGATEAASQAAISERRAEQKPEKPREQILFDDKGHPAGILNLDTNTMRPMPPAATKLFKGATKGAAKWGPMQALMARSRAMQQAKTELTKPPSLWNLGTATPPSGAVLLKRTNEILAGQGLDPTGNPLPGTEPPAEAPPEGYE